MHKIDYTQLLTNVVQMINLLEFDAMRSAGKAKLNSQHLEALYTLKDRYEAQLAATKPATKAVKSATK